MFSIKWYLSTWCIGLCFVFSIFIIPFILGVTLLALRMKVDGKIKRYYQESGFNEVIKIKEEKEKIDNQLINILKNIDKQKEALNALEQEKQLKIDQEKEELNLLEQEKRLKQSEIVVLDDELLYQSFGFYDPKYEFENSELYKARLEEVREKQKDMVKNSDATIHSEEWQLDGSKEKGRVMNNNNIKLTMRSFNNECDNTIAKVKFNNIESTEKRIIGAYNTLNKINQRNKIEIKKEYLALKLDELYLAYEYQQKKEEEREEQRQLREQIREEAKVQQEIETQRKKIEKDEMHFKQALEKYQTQLLNADGDLKEQLQARIDEINNKIEELQKEKESVDFREQNAKAGYVYIISNIGSFGENVFKIGMTRRLEPFDRVKELGDASVPFLYDVHAMIFTDDAPQLEAALHREFDHRRLNMVNTRKEFFEVGLKEIEEVVKEKHNKVVEFTKLAEAEEWRRSQQIKDKMINAEAVAV